jgi:hypothetical protein
MQPETDFLEPDVLSVALRLLSNGPADIEWLTRRLRTQLKDARLTTKQVTATVESATMLVGRPDGRVCRLLDVLNGQTLTHRVTAATDGRTDLWTDLSLQPLYVCAMVDPIPLTTGGQLRAADFGHSALVGPRGWLPDIAAGGLLAVCVDAGRVHLEALPDGVNASPAHEQEVRETLARHIRLESWWSDFGEPNREAELNRAIGNALLEDPALFATPVSPLIELLHDVLTEHSRRHLFDDTAAWEAGDVVSMSIAGMPENLFGELTRRAHKYGMSFDRFVVATLGHAAWRTPFAEDLGPWEEWDRPCSVAPTPTHLQAVADRDYNDDTK